MCRLQQTCLAALCCLVLTVKANGQRRVLKEVNYTIPEGIEQRKLVGDLIMDTGLKEQYDDAIVSMLQFEFLSPKGQYQSYYNLEHNTGMLYTDKKIDREEMCAYQEECMMYLDVVVQPFEYFQIIKVQISILDLNDDDPKFPDSKITLSISEGTTPGRGFPIPAADDMDSPRNGIKGYSLDPQGGKFQLEVTKTLAGDTKLQLVLTGKLDREVRESYDLRVLAKDGGFPFKTGLLNIEIVVGDVNDNSPIFDNATYSLRVSEGLDKGSVALRVHATDLDGGPNGKVVYQFSKKTQATFGHIFGIKKNSGDIYMVGELDYEEKKTFHLSVIAHDQSVDPLYAYTDVVIHVEDINDHPPDININPFTSFGVAKISEWARQGQFVAHVTISDRDSGENGRYSCTVSDNHFTLKPMRINDFELLTAEAFDREKKQFYNVTIYCRDHGTPQLSSSSTIKVEITDENDNYPTFQGAPYKAQLEENNDIDASIIKLEALDKDRSDNGHVKYRLDGPYGELIDIEEETGVVRARVTFDYEHTSQLEFAVIAYDQGIPARSATTTVELQIININDQPPVFEKSNYMFAIEENQPVNTEVGRLQASDTDAPPYNSFTFSLFPNSDANYFYIDPKSGIIKTRKSLDREARPDHLLLAVVTDQGIPRMSTSVSVKVHVSDQNDNPPVVEFPNPANYTVNIPAETPVGYEVSRIRAVDADANNNAKISFYILEQTIEGMFSIDPWTGVITMNKPPKQQNQYLKVKLNVQVKDNGSPQNPVETTLNVVLDKTIPFVPKANASTKSIFVQNNAFLLILCIVIAISVVLIMALVVAIICVRRRRRLFRHPDYSYCGPVTTEVKPGGYLDRIRAPPSYDDFLESHHTWGTATKTNRMENVSGDNSGILYFQSEELLRKYLPNDPSTSSPQEGGQYGGLHCDAATLGTPGHDSGTTSGVGTEVMERSTIQLEAREPEIMTGSPQRIAHVKRSTSSDYANIEDIRPHHAPSMKRSPSGPHAADTTGPASARRCRRHDKQQPCSPGRQLQQPGSPTWPGPGRSQSFTHDPMLLVGCIERVNINETPMDSENNLTSTTLEINSNDHNLPVGDKQEGPAPGPAQRPRNLKSKGGHRKGEYRAMKQNAEDGHSTTGSLPAEERGHRQAKGERSARDHRRHRQRRHGQARKEQQDNVANELYEKNRLSNGTSSSDTLPRIPEDKLRPLPCPATESVPLAAPVRAPTEGAEFPHPVNTRLTLIQPGNGHEDSSDQSETRIHNGQKSQSSDSDIGVCGISHRSIEV